jgi:hypothetical protein
VTVTVLSLYLEGKGVPVPVESDAGYAPEKVWSFWKR